MPWAFDQVVLQRVNNHSVKNSMEVIICYILIVAMYCKKLTAVIILLLTTLLPPPATLFFSHLFCLNDCRLGRIRTTGDILITCFTPSASDFFTCSVIIIGMKSSADHEVVKALAVNSLN